jgi:polar amino acid transport system substrate-binding protein
MLAQGEADGLFSGPRTAEREGICSFPDEPLIHDRWVFFVRTADVGKLKFSSFDDLVGHDVAVPGIVPGLFQQSIVPPDLWKFLREHDNMVATNGALQGLQMLAAGRVDYAFANLPTGMRAIAAMGLSGKIEPLLSHGAMEGGQYVCFNKARFACARRCVLARVERIQTNREISGDTPQIFSVTFIPRDNRSRKEKGRPVSRTAFPVSRQPHI